MLKIGQYNNLVVVKEVNFGIYLDGGEWGEILLPNKFIPKDYKLNEPLNVFVYFDSEDKIIATTTQPRATIGSCAFLKVVDVNQVGAFLDWGLEKDLLVPRPEQHRPMEKGHSYLVYLKQDNEGRIIASSKIDHFLHKTPPTFQRGDEVDLLIAETTQLGRKAIINNTHWGLIHAGDIFQHIGYGKKMKGYIKTVREDGKIDLVLRKIGHDKIHELADRILTELQNKDGYLPLHDKSSSDEIQLALNESKKSFKMAIGQLYKQGKITIESNGIRLKKHKPGTSKP